MTRRVTQAEFARLMGVSRQAIHKAIRSGRVTLGDDGRIDADAGAAEWRATTRADVASGAAANPAPRRRGGGDDDLDGYRRARAAHEVLRVREMRIKVREREGAVVDVAAVVDAWAAVLRPLRDRLRGLGARVAQAVAASDDPIECRRLVDEEVDDALRIIADTIPGVIE